MHNLLFDIKYAGYPGPFIYILLLRISGRPRETVLLNKPAPRHSSSIMVASSLEYFSRVLVVNQSPQHNMYFIGINIQNYCRLREFRFALLVHWSGVIIIIIIIVTTSHRRNLSKLNNPIILCYFITEINSSR